MQITDSCVHIWGADTPERPWPPIVDPKTQPHKPFPFTKEYILGEMAKAGVDRVVLVPAVWEGERNDLAIAAVQEHPDRFRIMGRFNPEAPGSRKLMPTWLQQPGMLGVRIAFQRPERRPLLTEGRIDWLWQQAEQFGVPIMLFARHEDLYLIDRVAERHPGLKLVIDHLGLTEGKDEVAFREFDKLLTLAKRPNVAVKASTLPKFTTDAYPFRRLHPYLRRVYDTFGPKRMFWGSDLSVIPCSYRQSVTMFTEEMPWIPSGDLELIMDRGLRDWIGWKLQ